MTSLIWGAGYLVHQGIIEHRRGRQREKNYQRWEDLRDDYDAQKKTQRLSLEAQRTGTPEYVEYQRAGSLDAQRTGAARYDERPILTLRDQQEANDARLSWRPQETFEEPRQGYTPQPLLPQGQQQPSLLHPQSRMSDIRPQKTGATWDEGLPEPLRVSRRSYDQDNSTNESRGSSTAGTSRQHSPPFANHTYSSSGLPVTNGYSAPAATSRQRQKEEEPQDAVEWWKTPTNVEPLQSQVPGGRMAELIDRGW